MNLHRSNRLFVAAALAAGTVACCAIARAAEPTREELQAQLHSLQNRVEQLQQQKAPQEISTINDVAADSQTRSHLLADNTGLTAGYDATGFFVGTDDQSFMLRPGVLLKIRNTTSFLEN